MTGSKSKSQQHATTSTTPVIPGWLQQPYQSFTGQVANLGAMDPSSFTTPATANQTAAFGRAGYGGAGSASTFNSLMGFQPTNVEAGQLASTDLRPYMNPFEGDVINATLGDFAQGNAMGLNQLRASTPTGAFNGSRQGVAEGQLTGDNMRTLASTLAGLRSANFAQAQGAAGQDIASRLQAGLANQGAAQSAAGLRLGAAGAGADNNRADIAQQLDAGGQQRSINSQTNPAVARLSLLQAMQGLLGQNPQMYAGSSGVADQTTTTKQSQSLLSSIATALQAIGALGGGGGGANPFLIAGG